ncbi:hypothetical protein Rhe02_06880 [Rhizocola hellebori]|uniref:Uncharacterized protein n=1 Tax=Rhizocola hellebori TaxID=1392758 RepID=A0A8J3VDP3_9ACTN|nr:hypothetical protein [Rhizocola hellebori]GIH02621.1 hypothetical protein Rhe02_06880 [Rhizocola hellebori]
MEKKKPLKDRTAVRISGAVVTAATLLAALYAVAAPMISNDPRLP